MHVAQLLVLENPLSESFAIQYNTLGQIGKVDIHKRREGKGMILNLLAVILERYHTGRTSSKVP
jgi:hypothetical protein